MKKILLFCLFTLAQSVHSQETLYFINSLKNIERQSVIRYLMNAFELENPDIRVELVFYDEEDDLNHILTLNNGENPHIIMADSRLLYRLSRIKGLDTELTGQILNNLGKDMYSGAVQAFRKDRKLYGIPYSAWLQVLWYRADWFINNNLPEPDSISNLLKASEIFQKPDESKYALILGKKNDIYLEQCFLHLAASLGLELTFKEGQTGFDRKKLKDILEIYYKLSKNSVPGESTWRFRDYFFQNQAAMLFYSTYLMDDLVSEQIMKDSLTSNNFQDLEGEEYDPDFFDNIGMVTTITGEKDSAFGSVSGIGIFSGLSESEKMKVQTLIEFMFRTEVYISWLHMSPGGMLPVKRSILNEEDFYRDHGGVFRRYGRRKIMELVEGLEYLQIINPELLIEEKEAGYQDKDFLKLLYSNLKNHSNLDEELNHLEWLY